MKKILFTYELRTATIDTIISQLDVVILHTTYKSQYSCVKNIRKNDLIASDWVISLRPTTPASEYIAEMTIASGKCFGVFYDDDLIEYYSRIAPSRTRLSSIKRCLLHANLLVFVNPLLGVKYKELYPKVDLYQFASPALPTSLIKKERDEIVRIIYATSNDHLPHFNSLILPALRNISNRLEKRVEVTFIGIHPRISERYDGISFHFLGHLPYLEYQSHMENNFYDIGIAPLIKDDFSSMKYYNKFLEYSKYAIMGIYSDMPPYNLVVQDGKNGLLAKASPAYWEDAIVKAVNQQQLREQCVYEAQEYLKTMHNPTSIAESFICALSKEDTDVIKHVHINPIRLKSLYYTFAMRDLMLKSVTNIRKVGILKTSKRVVEHLAFLLKIRRK